MLSPHQSYPPLEMAQAGIVTITNSCFGKNLGRVANNIISLDRVAEDTISESIGSAILRANVCSKPMDWRRSELGSFVGSGTICPNSGKLQVRKGIFDSLFRHAKPRSASAPHEYNAEELGRLLMLTRASDAG
jgi:hypothetical protein